MRKVFLSIALGVLLLASINGVVKASSTRVYYNYNFRVLYNNGTAEEIDNPYGYIQTDFAPRSTTEYGENLVGYNLYRIVGGNRYIVSYNDYALRTNASGLFSLGYASSSRVEVEVRSQNYAGNVAYKGWVGSQIFNSYN